MTVGFGTAVHSEMLDAGESFIAAIDLLLQPFHAGGAHAGSEVRVFTVGFHAASPARIPENVDVRCEKSKSGIIIVLSGFLGTEIFQSGFVSHHAEHFLHGVVVEGGRQCYGHWIDRGETVARHTVQRLVPPAVCRNA